MARRGNLFVAEKYLAGTACPRPILNPAPLLPPQAAADQRNSFMPQKPFGEGRVPPANICETFHGPRASKQFCLKPFAPRPLAQETVYQKLHQMDPIPFRVPRYSILLVCFLARKQKVVHPADREVAVAQARRDTRAEQSR